MQDNLLALLEQRPELALQRDAAIAEVLGITAPQVAEALAPALQLLRAPIIGDSRWQALRNIGDRRIRRYGNYGPVSIMNVLNTFAGRALNFSRLANSSREAFQKTAIILIGPVDAIIPHMSGLYEELPHTNFVIIDTASVPSSAAYNELPKRKPALAAGENDVRVVPSDFAGRANEMSSYLTDQGFDLKESISVSTVPATGGRNRENEIDLIWRKDRLIVSLGEPTLLPMSELVGKVAAELHSGARDEISPYREQAASLVEFYDAIRSSVTVRQSAITDMRMRAADFESNVQRYLEDYTHNVRNLHDINQQIERDEPRAIIDGIEDFKRSFQTVQLISRMRAIESCYVDNGALVLNLHPYIMKLEAGWRDYNESRQANTGFIKIATHTISINTTAESFSERRITISAGMRTGGIWHPHVSNGQGCFGNAVARIGEAWGRRDWESVVHMILQWWTAYNDRSPYNRPRRSQLLTGETAPHWVIPEAPATTNETSPELELANA